MSATDQPEPEGRRKHCAFYRFGLGLVGALAFYVLEPVLNFLYELSVQCIYVPALSWG